MAKKENTSPTSTPVTDPNTRFKLFRSKIQQMYKDDNTIKNNVNKSLGSSTTLSNLTLGTLKSQFYNANSSLTIQRDYAEQAYTYWPIYTNMVEYFSNMYSWRYTYVPHQVKEKIGDYKEIYDLMGEVVDGLNIEVTYPMILKELFTVGAAYLITMRNTSAKTISTLLLPYKYCRPSAISQFGTVIYQFNFQYFDALGLSADELDKIFEFYPKEMREQYDLYKKDNNAQWQLLDPKFAGAILLNKNGFPSRLYGLFGILQFQQYLDNELERSGQLLDKIVSHKIPTWQDKLILEIDEMTELHQTMASILNKNKHIRLLTTFGDIDVHSVGEDSSKENKTLENAYNAIYDVNGLNHALFNSESVKALEYAIIRDKNYVWQYIERLTAYYNVVINNNFNFKGYQCNLTLLPITSYDEESMLLAYKEGATLGINKLEYIVATGVKQVNITSKLKLEDYLKLDQLKPLSTSYTQSGKTETTPTDSSVNSGDDSSNEDNEQSDSNKKNEVETDE